MMTLDGTQTGIPAVGHAFRYGLSRAALGRQQGGILGQEWHCEQWMPNMQRDQ
jgi:hypothetical protein